MIKYVKWFFKKCNVLTKGRKHEVSCVNCIQQFRIVEYSSVDELIELKYVLLENPKIVKVEYFLATKKLIVSSCYGINIKYLQSCAKVCKGNLIIEIDW